MLVCNNIASLQLLEFGSPSQENMTTSLMQNARFLQEFLLTGLLIDATSKSEDYIIYMYILYFFSVQDCPCGAACTCAPGTCATGCKSGCCSCGGKNIPQFPHFHYITLLCFQHSSIFLVDGCKCGASCKCRNGSCKGAECDSACCKS